MIRYVSPTAHDSQSLSHVGHDSCGDALELISKRLGSHGILATHLDDFDLIVRELNGARYKTPWNDHLHVHLGKMSRCAVAEKRDCGPLAIVPARM